MNILIGLAFFLVLTGSVFAIANESFSLDFPVTNGTTTYITFEDEQAKVSQNVMTIIPLVLIIFVGSIVVVHKMRS